MRWKLVFFSKDIFNKVINLKIKKNISNLIFKKNSFIPSLFLHKKLFIYKGFFFRYLIITKYIINYKFGEFLFTKKPFKFIKKNKKIKR